MKDDFATCQGATEKSFGQFWAVCAIYSKFIRMPLVMYSFDHTFIIYDSITETWYVTWWRAAGSDPANKIKEGDFSNIW